MSKRESHHRYWRANLIVLVVLLSLWFLVGCACGILFVEPLNEIRLGGFPLGFWIAQQGAIIVFIFLILTYALIMRWLDRKYDVEEDRK